MTSLTVAVEGGDPVFSIDGPDAFADEIEVDEDDPVTLEDVAAGAYTITLIDPDDVVVDAIDCDPEGTDVDLADGSVTVEVGEGEDVVCTFTISAADDSDPYDTYDDDLGDSGFDFDTPFVDADDPAPVEVAATSQPVVAQQPAQPEVPVVVAGEVVPAAAPDAAPVALAELPRTGSRTHQMTMVGGVLLIAGGVASLIGRRRKAASA
jgi:LPXTG-motif cell wall-anchored protein